MSMISNIIMKNQKKTLMKKKEKHKTIVQRTLGNGMLPNTEEL